MSHAWQQKSQIVYRMHIFILSPQHFKLLPGGTAMGREKLFTLGKGIGFMSIGIAGPAILFPVISGMPATWPVPHVEHFAAPG